MLRGSLLCLYRHRGTPTRSPRAWTGRLPCTLCTIERRPKKYAATPIILRLTGPFSPFYVWQKERFLRESGAIQWQEHHRRFYMHGSIVLNIFARKACCTAWFSIKKEHESVFYPINFFFFRREDEFPHLSTCYHVLWMPFFFSLLEHF